MEAELEVAQEKIFLKEQPGMDVWKQKEREARLRWFGCLRRKDIGGRMMEMELPGRRKKGRPKRRFLDAVKEDKRLAGVTEEDAGNRVRIEMICCGDP